MAPAGKVIIVTGASRGIGFAVAKFLLEQSSLNRLLLVSRTTPVDSYIESAVKEKRVKIVQQDLSDAKNAGDIVDIAIKEFGQLDGLVLNHATLSPVKRIGVGGGNVDDWTKTFNINFFSALSIVQAALSHLRASKGRIVFTSSGAATSAYTGWGAYGATKAAMNHLTQTLAAEEPDIVSISIRPGIVDTEMQREIREVHNGDMVESEVTEFVKLKAEGKLLRPDQPGNVMARLVLDAPNTLSGKFIRWSDPELAPFQDK